MQLGNAPECVLPGLKTRKTCRNASATSLFYLAFKTDLAIPEPAGRNTAGQRGQEALPIHTHEFDKQLGFNLCLRSVEHGK